MLRSQAAAGPHKPCRARFNFRPPQPTRLPTKRAAVGKYGRSRLPLKQEDPGSNPGRGTNPPLERATHAAALQCERTSTRSRRPLPCWPVFSAGGRQGEVIEVPG